MIKFNNSDIIDWNFGDDNIIKVYHNGAIVFYKFDTEQGGYKVCYAVVDDIAQYSETEFEDVYDKATAKWYKLNNLNQYEEYGVYGSGRNITTYDGKLTIDDGYEYQYSGGSWVNVGETSGTSVIWLDPNSTGSLNPSYQIGHYWGEGYKMIYTLYINGSYSTDTGSFWHYNSHSPIEFNFYSNGFYYDFHNPTSTTAPNVNTSDYSWRIMKNGTLNSYESGQVMNITLTNGTVKVALESTGVLITSGSTSVNAQNWYNGLYQAKIEYWINGNKAHIKQIQVYNENDVLVNDLTFVKNPNVTGSQEISVYDSVLNVKYDNTNSNTPLYHEESGSIVYPVYYDEIQDPPNNLSFSSMTEAQDYAYNNCVYDGMKALIDGDRYVFDSDEGWVVVPEYYYVEDVTPGGTSGWTITGSSTYNPQPSYYDDFDLETTSTSSSYKIAKVTIYGYDHFTYYLRSYNQYSSSYAYVMATNVDEVSTPPSTMSYNSSSAITNTYNWNKSPKSTVNLSNYRRVTYNNLDKTVEHTFYVYFYGRTYSSYVGNATILIPKEQTNENWEQVTFSASSNVASSTKNLYIDGNNSTSGGTGYFYRRWIVGLPSGSHSSYTNYSDYSYCPNVTSSTFTSVAGNSRQVNYTYDNTTNKNLSMRMVDTNGNVITPTNTIYYYIYRYNSCNVSNNASISLPSTQTLKVGGRFYFGDSSNRHYIYGYTAPATGTTYYVDNYSSTFDLVYTALTRESVSVTYTTYDPSDVEVPSFKTDITWPYSGGTTSSTTLTSYTVPYTYPYNVSQTSDKFSADSQAYTAGQSSRTINFVLYPDNREFATVADMEAYAYAWEGMKASVNGTNYQYKNGEWVEQSYAQYEYIRTQSGSTKHYYNFNTNFYPTTANTLEIKFAMTDNSIDWGRIVAWGTPGNTSYNKSFEFDTVTNGYQAIIRTGGNNGVTYRPTIGANKVGIYTLPLSGSSGTYSVDGGSSQTIQYNHNSLFSLPSTVSMRILGNFRNDGATYDAAAVGKLYYVKVYDGNNNLVKHYVPSDNNGSPCLYEIVDGEYIMDTYTGSNHGTLTLGPEV